MSISVTLLSAACLIDKLHTFNSRQSFDSCCLLLSEVPSCHSIYMRQEGFLAHPNRTEVKFSLMHSFCTRENYFYLKPVKEFGHPRIVILLCFRLIKPLQYLEVQVRYVIASYRLAMLKSNFNGDLLILHS